MSAKTRDPLEIIRQLRKDGAVEVEVDGIKAKFSGPPAPPQAPKSVEELQEIARRTARRPRTDDERLLGPLGILDRQPK